MKTFKIRRQYGEAWVAALRSGEFTQRQLALANQYGYCCLGVLCEVAINLGAPVVKNTVDGDNFTYDLRSQVLPELVIRSAGIKNLNCSDNYQNNDPNIGKNTPASYLNDCQGLNFNEIADLIEEYGEFYE